MKIEIGKLIKIVDERNSDASINTFFGININKEFMPTVANTDGIDCRKYKVVRKNRFVFSGMQTGRDECIRISLFAEDDPIIISPAYTTFEITRPDLVFNEYFFMRFLSKEMDRYGSFFSDSSIRSNLDWERFCEIDLPSITVQKKYIDVYNSLLQNQKTYEKGLNDLKLTCDAYIENLRHDVTTVAIGDYIKESDNYNSDLKYGSDDVKGMTITKEIIPTKANLDNTSFEKYIVVNPKHFIYNPRTHGKKIGLGFNNDTKTFIISWNNIAFYIRKEAKGDLLPEYLFLFFLRDEWDRWACFNSWGSSTEVFAWEDLCETKIPLPDISVQKAIVDIFTAYNQRKAIAEKLKRQIKDICPILVRGAMEEGG